MATAPTNGGITSGTTPRVWISAAPRKLKRAMMDQDHAQDRDDHEGDEEQRHTDEDRDLGRAAAEAGGERRPGDRYRGEG
jgi:hypothetical protein